MFDAKVAKTVMDAVNKKAGKCLDNIVTLEETLCMQKIAFSNKGCHTVYAMQKLDKTILVWIVQTDQGKPSVSSVKFV